MKGRLVGRLGTLCAPSSSGCTSALPRICTAHQPAPLTLANAGNSDLLGHYYQRQVDPGRTRMLEAGPCRAGHPSHEHLSCKREGRRRGRITVLVLPLLAAAAAFPQPFIIIAYCLNHPPRTSNYNTMLYLLPTRMHIPKRAAWTKVGPTLHLEDCQLFILLAASLGAAAAQALPACPVLVPPHPARWCCSLAQHAAAQQNCTALLTFC